MDPKDEREELAEEVFVEWLRECAVDDETAFAALCEQHPLLSSALNSLRDEWHWLEELCESADEDREEPLGALDASVERYNRLERIGEGGMGIVHAAWDSRCQRELAMKVCRVDHGKSGRSQSSSALRFLEEARIMSRLEHPGVVPIHDLGIDCDGRIFFTMRRVRGHDLGTIIQMVHSHNVDWTLDKAVQVLVRVCETVAFAHSQGIIHRDLKPSNIMVSSFDRAYVIDWGLAHVRGRRDSKAALIHEGLEASTSHVSPGEQAESTGVEHLSLRTADGAVIGTPAYMSPEQACGELDLVGTRSDIYSAGAILYHILAGHGPYRDTAGKEAVLVLEQLRERPPTSLRKLKPEASVELLAICEKAMSRKAPARYESMAALARDLEAHRAMRVVSAHNRTPLGGAVKWARRNTTQAALNALGVLAIGSVLAALWYSGNVHSESRLVLQESLRESSTELAAVTGLVEQQRRSLAELEEQERLSRYAQTLDHAERLIESRRGKDALEMLDACEPEFRGWEWSLLRAELLEGSTRIQRPGSARDRGLSAVARLSGSTFAMGGKDGLIHVRDTEKETPRLVLNHGGPVRSFAVSSDAGTLYAGGLKGFLSRWDLRSGQLTAKTRAHAGGFMGSIADLSLDPSERWIASAGGDRVAKILNADTLEPVATLESLGHKLYSVAFSPDGKELVTYDSCHVLRFWSIPDWTLRASLKMEPDSGRTIHKLCARYSADGEHVACNSSSGTIYDVEVRGPRVVRRLREYSGHSHDLEFSADGQMLVTATGGGLALWDWESGTRLRSLHSIDGHDWSAAFADPADVLLASSDQGNFRTIALDGPRARSSMGVPAPPRHMELTPDGSLLAVGCREGLVMLLDTESSTWRRRLPGPSGGWCTGLSFSAQGKLLAAGMTGGLVWVWDLESLTCRQPLRLADDPWAVSFSKPTGHLLVGDSKGSVHRWSADFESHDELVTFAGLEVRSLEVLEERPIALIGLSSGEVTVVDIEEGTLLHRSRDHSRRVSAISLSPDQTRYVSCSFDGSIAVGRCEDWSSRVLVRLPGETFHSVAFSTDGERILGGTEGGDLVVFGAERGDELWRTSVDGWVIGLAPAATGQAIYALAGQPRLHLFDPDLTRTPLADLSSASTEARDLVHTLREELCIPSVMRARVEQADNLDAKQQQSALSLIELSHPDVTGLATRAWSQLVNSDGSTEDHAHASKQLTAAAEILPCDVRLPFMQALSEERAGHPREGLKRLERYYAEMQERDRQEDPRAWAVELLCLIALGNYDRLHECLAAMEEWQALPGHDRDPDFRVLMSEVRRSLQTMESGHEQ